MSELTILSVYHSEKTRKFIEWNYENLKRSNPNAFFVWMVTDNSPDSLKEKLAGEGFVLFPKVVIPKNAPEWMYPSLWHTLALNQMAPHLETRFALFLDADFLMLYPNWLEEVLGYMKKNDLGIFGAPYHPRDFKKPRYFPSIPCMFLDSEKVDVRNIDYRPQYPSVLGAMDGRLYKNNRFKKLWSRLGSAIFGERFRIDSSRDSGSAIYNRYAKSNVKYEFLTPVFRAERDFMGPAWTKFGWNRLLEKFLPERLCFLPKRKKYYSETGFKELGYFDIAGLGLEEYLWNAKPFGFHFRGTFAKKMTPEEEVRIAEEVMRGLVKTSDTQSSKIGG